MKKIILILGLILVITSCTTQHFFISTMCTEKKTITNKDGISYVTTFKFDTGGYIVKNDKETYNKAEAGKRSMMEVSKKKFNKLNK